MRIQYASHLFKAAQKQSFRSLLTPVAPTLVLAGNCVQPWTTAGREFLRDASFSFDNVYVVPGPAEYSSNPSNCYTRNLTELYHAVHKFSNTRILDNRAYDIDKTNLIAGTTLWHHLNEVGLPVRDMIGVNMKYKAENKGLVLDMINKHAIVNMFLEGRNFLRTVVLNPENIMMNVVFGTYHVPTYKLLTSADKADFNTAVMSNNEFFYCERPLKAWIAGAGTGATQFIANDVQFVKNSYGNGEEADPSYSTMAVIDVCELSQACAPSQATV